jgi:hypothetical protein
MAVAQKKPQNLFDLYLDFVKDTEAPLVLHRWSLISCLSAVLGRQCWIPFGSGRIFPNQYIMLIGEPGARKSSAIKAATKLILRSGYTTFAASKTTKEKFLLDLEGLEDVEDSKLSNDQVMKNILGESLSGSDPKEVFISPDEFNDFMRCGDLEFHAMLGSLWDYDNEDIPYTQRLKNSKSIAIYQPTINILGGNTHTGFSEMFPPQALGQGFLSRMLLIFSEPSGRKIAFPKAPDPALETALIEMLQRIRTEFTGPLTLSKEATQALTEIYNTYQGFPDMRFTSYFTRRYTHLLKMCIICAAVEFHREITIRDVILANTLLKYAEHFMPQALGEFGKAKNADVATRILALLTKEDKVVEVGAIWKQVSNDLDTMLDLDKMLHGLKTAGKILWVPKSEDSVAGYVVIRKTIKSIDSYVDYNLLREYKLVKI